MNRPRRRRLLTGVLLLACLVGGVVAVTWAAPAPGGTVSAWETSGSGVDPLARQPSLALSAGAGGGGPRITVDDSVHYQTMAGFGASMTDSSAYVLMHDMTAAQRSIVMTRLFSRTRGIGLDYLRVPIGANDFSTSDYSEDDLPPGQSDPGLRHFNINHDLGDLVPALKAALAIDPSIQIMASPWSPPAWMKTSGSLIGGSLRPIDLGVYARYLTRFVQAYAAQGIPIAALTMQNEPDYTPSGYPGMAFGPVQEALLAPLLGQDLAAAGLHTQIIGFDSDWSDVAYPLNVLANTLASRYLSGTAFHCYDGAPAAQLTLQLAFPRQPIYETECTGISSYPNFAADLAYGTGTLVIDAVRDWSRTVMLWNLVLDQHGGPTNGGCLDCVPNVTVNSATGDASYNVEYDILGQVSRFVAPGARRIASASPAGSLQDVAFLNPNGQRVLVVLNAGAAPSAFTVVTDGKSFTGRIGASSVETFTWS